MADTAQHGTPYGPATAALRDAIRRIADRAAGRIGRCIRQMQYARMLSVLSAMPQEQLTQIGVTRAEIPRHAAYLVGLPFAAPEAAPETKTLH